MFITHDRRTQAGKAGAGHSSKRKSDAAERSQEELRSHAASLALGAAVGLTALKLGVGIWTGSVGVWSEGLHSSLDLISAAVAYFTIREAGKAADPDHPFGHGKFETLSSLLESLLLVAAAFWILWESVTHLKNPEPISNSGWAMGVIAFSAVASFFVFRQNSKAADLTDSSAIRVNALHSLADVITSLGVLLGLALLELTGWLWVDPLIGVGIAAYIVAISWKQMVASVQELLDQSLPEVENRRIEEVLSALREKHPGEVLDVHDLRTRKSGAMRHMDFHVEVCADLTVQESHAMCDRMEETLHEEFPGSSVTIHVEPCGEHGFPKCRETCPIHKARMHTLHRIVDQDDAEKKRRGKHE